MEPTASASELPISPMGEVISQDAKTCLEAAKQRMSQSSAMHHRFLIRFRDEALTHEQLKTFAILWYKAARAHKLAFPALIWNVPDDDVRFDLIDILREEYGNGDRDSIHSRMLFRFLTALGVSESDVEATPTPMEIEQFSKTTLSIWRDGAPAYAFGLHFALEFLASSLHVYFASGLRKYDFLSNYSREYFEYHSVAEERHADHSEDGFIFYANRPERQSDLLRGVYDGVALLEQMWIGFERSVLAGNPKTNV